MQINSHLRKEVLSGSLFSRELEVLCQLMDIIINLYQRKTETIFVTKSLKIQKEKCREKENWSFEENVHQGSGWFTFCLEQYQKHFVGF